MGNVRLPQEEEEVQVTVLQVLVLASRVHAALVNYAVKLEHVKHFDLSVGHDAIYCSKLIPQIKVIVSPSFNVIKF